MSPCRDLMVFMPGCALGGKDRGGLECVLERNGFDERALASYFTWKCKFDENNSATPPASSTSNVNDGGVHVFHNTNEPRPLAVIRNRRLNSLLHF